MKTIKYIVSGLAVAGVALLVLLTFDKVDSATLFKKIKEWRELKNNDMKRKDDVITTPTGTIDIPESLQHKHVVSAETTDAKETTGTILHEVHDRRNKEPIKDSALEFIKK